MDLHSPYQNVSVKFNNNQLIPITVQSNNIWLQVPLNLSEEFFVKQNKDWYDLYSIPHKIKAMSIITATTIKVV